MHAQLELLDRTIEKLHVFPEDLGLPAFPICRGWGNYRGYQPLKSMSGMKAETGVCKPGFSAISRLPIDAVYQKVNYP